MAQFTFIALDEFGKAKKDDNKLIRSACMRGKNEKPDSRRSQRRARKLAAPASKFTSESTASEKGPNTKDSEHFHNAESDLRAANVAFVSLTGSPNQDMRMSNASMISFLTKVDEQSLPIVCKFMRYWGPSSLLYPLERHLAILHSVDMATMFSDDGLRLSSLVSVCSMNDYILRRPLSALTISHIHKLLRRINVQLSNLEARNLWVVILAIITLGTVSTMFGDHTAAKMHIQGLQRIAISPGGEKYLLSFPKFHFKIVRLDLSYSLITGRAPLFKPPSIFPALTWHPFFPGSSPLPPHQTSPFTLPAFSKLTSIYGDLRYLTHLINTTVSAHTEIPVDLFHNCILSAQLRLLRLQGCMEDSVAECLRLGMLAFLTTTFQLPGRKIEYVYLARKLREMLQGVVANTVGARRVVFWVLVMSFVAVFEVGEEEAWAGDVWERFVDEGGEWEEVKKDLMGMIWIPLVHDEPAEKVFRFLESGKDRS